MKKVPQALASFLYRDLIFSPRYRIWRHVIYWFFHIIVWSIFWQVMGDPASFGRNLFNMSLWIPVFVLFSYPLVYGAVPYLILKGKVVEFFLLIFAWGIAGLYINSGFRTYVYSPLQEALGLDLITGKVQEVNSYLCMAASAASLMIIKFFKEWTLRQEAWIRTRQEKVTAELQLLKAQVHPHFLFNTLNNIYSFSMDSSPKTPGLILKLSSLLHYMLFDCKADEVSLEKEIEIMKNYIDLEIERYGNTMTISWSVDGDVKNKFISPLLMLPFLENAFKHGLSEQIEEPWLCVHISVKSDSLRCEIANGKNVDVPQRNGENGIGISNVRKRLAFIYPDNHELKMHDGGSVFVVSLLVELTGFTSFPIRLSPDIQTITT